jgi:hypothetical protein
VSRVGPGATVPRSPRHVLEELVARGDRAAAAGQPRLVVTLELASGRSLQGRCVALGDDGGLPMVLLHTGGSERAPEVMHVRVDHVVAVGYEAAPEPVADRTAPGRLEISRALSSVADEVSAKLGGKLELTLGELADDPRRHAVMALVPVLRQVLVRLAGDAMGAEALRALAAVRIGAATTASVVLANRELPNSRELQIDTALFPTEEWTAPDLQAAIEKAL